MKCDWRLQRLLLALAATCGVCIVLAVASCAPTSARVGGRLVGNVLAVYAITGEELHFLLIAPQEALKYVSGEWARGSRTSISLRTDDGLKLELRSDGNRLLRLNDREFDLANGRIVVVGRSIGGFAMSQFTSDIGAYAPGDIEGIVECLLDDPMIERALRGA